jgi:hypothetical protein
MNNYDISNRLVGILADFVVCCKHVDGNYVVNVDNYNIGLAKIQLLINDLCQKETVEHTMVSASCQ